MKSLCGIMVKRQSHKSSETSNLFLYLVLSAVITEKSVLHRYVDVNHNKVFIAVAANSLNSVEIWTQKSANWTESYLCCSVISDESSVSAFSFAAVRLTLLTLWLPLAEYLAGVIDYSTVDRKSGQHTTWTLALLLKLPPHLLTLCLKIDADTNTEVFLSKTYQYRPNIKLSIL